MSDLEDRIKQGLEPVLELPDPRQRISTYHDMPYAAHRKHQHFQGVVRKVYITF
jgi:hypothetical protein